jgi:hypothetical protein
MKSNTISRKEGKIKSWIIIVCMVLLLASLAYAGTSMIYGESVEDTPLPHFLGNKPGNIAALEDKDAGPAPFSFFIAGDLQQADFFPAIYKDFIGADSPDFGVILGDFVRPAQVESHTGFMLDFASWGVREPVFLVCGNHDILTKEDTKRSGLFKGFTLADFERTYGPADFSFTYRGCLFVILNDIDTDRHVAYLADVLSHRKSDTLMTFVFTHIPAHTISPEIKSREMRGEDKFLSLVKKYKVDYVISGDFHSYFRAKVGDTNYLISGGGMGRDGDNRENRKGSYHAVLIRVDPTTKTVDERIYTGESRLRLAAAMKTNMLVQVFPFLEYQEKAGLPIMWGGSLISVFLGLWLFSFSVVAKRAPALATVGGGALAVSDHPLGGQLADGKRPPYTIEISALKKYLRRSLRELDPLTSTITLLQHLVIARAGIRSSRYYQPIYGGVSTRSKRDCTKRWEAMKRCLPSYEFSFLDTGSEIGYFTFKASESGAVALGVERRKKLADLATTIRSVRKMDRTAFLNIGIDIITVRSLPQVDVLCCLSIFHHWVSEWGLPVADRIFSILCEKTTSIFFETGQPDERVDWAEKLTFMEPDIEGWITRYLIEKGFSKVSCLGGFSTNRGDTRLLFFASK